VAGIWYKDKDYYATMQSFQSQAAEIGSEDLWEEIKKLRTYAQEYNDKSLSKGRREKRGIDLSDVAEQYYSQFEKVENLIKQHLD
jgi:vacuolar-type H+-ATPase subunit B/Vma2